MKKGAFLALSLVAPIAVLAGCGQSDVDKQVQPQQAQPSQQLTTTVQHVTGQMQKQTKQKTGKNQKTTEQLLKERMDAQDKQIQDLTKEVEYYRTFVKNFTSTFSTDQMNEFIDKEWSYKLMISDINLPKDGVLDLSNTSFDLVMTEDRVPYSVIPDEMSEKGRIVDDGSKLQDVVTFDGDTKPDIKADIHDKDSVVTYSFKDVPKGTVIKATISDSLKKELNMDTNNVEIHIQ